ncbi:dehydrogenase [Fusarium tjaetaba]|uniref:Dehydrogenase n=1 Tax=Fusarium tjaetaba TaxID=1567544 RepID=A0A8H5QMH5_9HYPO|nr:dehydrogenase [Fusarium tjaetaba]KAF5617278.1 dehydrogenase [Fusarium tjaetaba]
MNILNGNALVTGAGSGIGRQLSLAYVRAGVKGITLADVNKDGVLETAKLIQAEFPDVKVLPLVVDVTNETSVNDMVDQAVKTFGTLDYAANAAGVVVKSREKSAYVPTSEFDRDKRRAQIGSIINFASVCGFQAMLNVMPYVASKHAVLGMTRSAALEHGPEGLRVNAVCPGIADTPFIADLKTLKGGNEQDPVFANPLGRLCYPDEIADAVVFLSSTMSSYVNGIALVSDGGKSVQY